MNHLIIFISCIFSIEVILNFNYISLVFSTIKLFKKLINIIFNKNISDHWKEFVVPFYSFKIMRYSFQMIFIFLFVAFIFFIGNHFSSGLLNFLLSPLGVIETIVISIGYLNLRKFIKNE